MKKEQYIIISKDLRYITVKFTYRYNGVQQQYSKTFSVSKFDSIEECYQAAIEHRDTKRAEMLLNGLPQNKKRSVGKVLEDYFRINKTTLGNKGVIQSRYDKYIKPYFDDTDIKDITPLDIQTSLNNMVYDATDNTIGRVYTVWNHIVRTARLMGVITINPLEQVLVPKSRISSEKRTQSLSDEDLQKILNYFFTVGKNKQEKFNNSMIGNFMIIMCETGMRPAEVSALERTHIDFDNHVIHVRQSIRSTDKERYTVGRTKTDSSIRDVPMTTQCELVLKRVVSESKNDRFLFTNYQGELLLTKKISQHINTVKKRLGIDFHLYMLRHRFSTKLVTNNVDPRTVMELMGHKNFGMTVSYARSDEEKKKIAIENNINSVELEKLN